MSSGLLAATVSLALVAVPLYFDPRTERVFEPDKLAWVLVLGLMASWALVVLAVERIVEGRRAGATRRGDRTAEVAAGRRDGRGRQLSPLGWALVFAAGALVVGTVASQVPVVSLWGAYRRGHGLFVYASLLALCAGTAVTAALPGALARLRHAILLPAVPISLYALLQRSGIDSVPWSALGASTVERAFGTMGNPIFLGAYLVMVIPFAVADLLDSAPRAATGGGRLRPVTDALVASVAVAALLATQSRGPVLGLLVGIAALGLTWLAASGRRRAVATLAAVAAIAAVGLLVVGRGPGDGSRLVGTLSPSSRTARERLLVWDAIGDLASSDPVAALVGYGPETLMYVLAPHVSDELVRLAPRQVFDRAHNVFLEWWVSAGALGVLAILALYTCASWACLAHLGLARTQRDAVVFALLMLCGVLVGGLAPAALGAGAYGAIGAPFGAIAAILGYVAIRGLASRPDAAAPSRAAEAAGAPGPRAGGVEETVPARGVAAPSAWFAAGCLAALTAHLAEGSVGLPTASGELLFWVLLGWLAAPRREPVPEPAESSDDGGRAVMDGVAVATVTNAPLLLPSIGATMRAPALWLLVPATWFAADALAGLAGAQYARRVATRLVVIAAFLASLALLHDVVGGAAVAYAVALAAATVALGAVIERETAPPDAIGAGGASPLRWAMYAALGLVFVAAAARIAVAPVVADAHIRAGLEAGVADDLARARGHFTRATRLWPDQPSYPQYVAAVDRDVMVAASTPDDVRDTAYRAASEALATADRMAGDHVLALRQATLERDRGDLAGETDARRSAWARSETFFALALRRFPRSPEALAERGALLERLGQMELASGAYAQAVSLDPSLAAAWAGHIRAALVTEGVDAASAIVDDASAHGAPVMGRLGTLLRDAEAWPMDSEPVLGAQVVYFARIGRPTDALAALRVLSQRYPNGDIGTALQRWLAVP